MRALRTTWPEKAPTSRPSSRGRRGWTPPPSSSGEPVPRAVFKEDGPIGWDAKAAKPVVLTECCGLLSRKGSPFSRKAVVAFSSHKDTLFGVCTLLQRVGYKGMVQWAFSAQLTQWL